MEITPGYQAGSGVPRLGSGGRAWMPHDLTVPGHRLTRLGEATLPMDASGTSAEAATPGLSPSGLCQVFSLVIVWTALSVRPPKTSAFRESTRHLQADLMIDRPRVKVLQPRNTDSGGASVTALSRVRSRPLSGIEQDDRFRTP